MNDGICSYFRGTTCVRSLSNFGSLISSNGPDKAGFADLTRTTQDKYHGNLSPFVLCHLLFLFFNLLLLLLIVNFDFVLSILSTKW